jgi:hypothetical protein
MKIPAKYRPLKIIGLVTLSVSALLYAAAVFIPSTQPTVSIGQYALTSRDLIFGDIYAYRPWFENGAWQGDIIEYVITGKCQTEPCTLSPGTRTTTAPVGLSCIDDASCLQLNDYGAASLAQANSSTRQNWMARATFRAKGADDPEGSYWENRNIITNNSGQVNFFWDELSTDQRAVLDPATVAAADPDLGGDASINDDPHASDILNYVRGQRLHERINDTVTGSNADLRTRYSVLGDITSTPLYIGPPREMFGLLTDFTAFSTAPAQANRDGRIAAGANDGMLHIFDEDDGSEVLAYVPSMVIDKLSRLAARDQAYDHTYYVAGELSSQSAYYGDAWHTVLAGSGGPGFAGLYALDVTNPDFPDTEDQLLFEKTEADGFGHIYGKPVIAPVGTGSTPGWYIFTGNGYSETGGHPTALKIISLDNPGTVHTIDTGSTGGLSSVTLLSTDSDNAVELAFAGDINGDLWMFEIDQSTPGSSTATLLYDGDPDQPIGASLTIGVHPSESGYLIFFGTGSLFSINDALNDGVDGSGQFTKKQAIYGIWVDTSDLSAFKTGLPYDANDLQTQTLVQADNATFRVTPTTNPVNYSCPDDEPSCTTHKGWSVELPNCGERLSGGSPFLRAGRVQFVSSNPTGLSCGERVLPGDSWIMSLDYLTGADGGNVVYNIDDKPKLDDLDKVDYNGDKLPPVGVHLGEGNVSQPVFARLDFGIDKMYVNGVILPLPTIEGPGPILGGHIDVETDSPTDGVIAKNSVSKHSEIYMVKTNDGLGSAVDGHVHDYDGMHGVNHVDLFELEPRRGKANLIATLGSDPVDNECSNERGSMEIKVTTTDASGAETITCIEAVEGELNRAYDTLHTDADGGSDPLMGTDETGTPTAIHQSEVHSLNAVTDFSAAVPNKSFIVTLANADLSNAGILQIGCRTWNVVDYQNMITEKLQDGRTTTAGLVDDAGGSLVFTLAGIMAEDPANCPGGANSTISEEEATANSLSPTPTIRIGFGQRAIIDGGVHATRSQCVLGLHDYNDKVCYTDKAVLTAAESKIASSKPYSTYSSCGGLPAPGADFLGVPADYLRDPADNLHITEAPSSEGSGYRWRNGALTLQLIDAGINPATELQDPATQVSGAGTIAKAFRLSGSGSKKTVVATDAEKGAAESGMLYEANIFWHYNALVDALRNADPVNNSRPPEGGCYGGPGYNGKTTIDVGGTNPAETRKLFDDLQDECEQLADSDPDATCRLDRFVELRAIIENAETEDDLNQALLELANMLEDDTTGDLTKLNELWDYIPEDEKPGCSDCGPTSTDKIPAKVKEFEAFVPEHTSPGLANGQLNWIDIMK